MRFFALTATSVLLVATAAFAARLPTTEVSGQYIEARNADVYTGPCFANSEVNLVGDLAVFGWHIDKGTWKGVPLDGLGVAAAVRASHTLGDLTRTPAAANAVLIIDQKADLDQRNALREFAEHIGGQLLSNVVRVDYAPIQFEVKDGNVHEGVATMTAGTLATIRTRALGEGDNICGNEQTWYPPLNKTTHAMPAFALADDFSGKGLDTVWKSPYKRSAFVGEFRYSE